MPFQKDGKRDYKKELQWEHTKKPKRVKQRAQRNAARSVMIKDGRAAVGDGQHVDHKQNITSGGTNDTSNLQVVSAKTNLKKEAKRKSGK